MTIDIKTLRTRCEAVAKNKMNVLLIPCQDMFDCLDEIERLRRLLRTISTKHNLLKGLSGYPPCSCKTNHMNLCMKHAAADIVKMINDELR